MECENYLCAYWNKNICILRRITLNAQGFCNDYICVNVDISILNEERKKLLASFEKQYKDWEERDKSLIFDKSSI